MAIRLSGMNSGLDTDAIVQELVSAYSLKTEKYEKASTKLTWKQDIWKNLNTKIYGLYTNISSLRYSSAYNLRKTTVSDNTKASVTANSDAPTGTQKLNILQTAQAGYITGGKLDNSVTSKTKLSDLGYTGGNTTITLKKNDGTSKEFKVTGNTTVNDFINSLKEAGVNASFDENNKRIFVSAKESGVAGDFLISSSDEDGLNALKALKLDVALVDANGNFTASAADYASAYKYFQNAGDANNDGVIDVDDVRTYLDNLVSQYETAKGERNVANGRYLLRNAETNDLKKELEELQTKYNGVDIDARKTEIANNMATWENDVVTAQANVDAIQAQIDALDPTDPNYATDKATLDAQLQTANNDLTAAQAVVDTADEDLTNFDRMQELPALITAGEEATAQAKADFDAKQAVLDGFDPQIVEFSEVKNDTEDGGQVVYDRMIYELSAKAVKANEIQTSSEYAKGGAVKIDATDAIIELNGVQFTSSSNSFSVNGLTINAQAVTGPGDANAIQITTSVDTQGIYDKVKDFLTEYNNVIIEMTRLYNAESAKDYEPLTDEEKEAMSDDQIEKWESKIKDSLLRRDTTLNDLMSIMVNSMSQVVDVNGEKVSLSTFGISTLGFLNAAENEHYAYHIDGDEDDTNTSGKTDKLMKAIQEDPDQIIEFMKTLTKSLYTEIGEKMKSTELSSVYKVYNDKEIDKEIKSIEDMIKKWKEKVEAEEDRYYKQFSQMEVALSKLQSQTSSLAGLLGQ